MSETKISADEEQNAVAYVTAFAQTASKNAPRLHDFLRTVLQLLKEKDAEIERLIGELTNGNPVKEILLPRDLSKAKPEAVECEGCAKGWPFDLNTTWHRKPLTAGESQYLGMPCTANKES